MQDSPGAAVARQCSVTEDAVGSRASASESAAAARREPRAPRYTG